MLFASLCFHAGLLLNGTFERSADGWIHLFFADHWLNSWWDNWEPRWYMGFSLFAYPPLAHQITALLAKVMGLSYGGITTLFVFLCTLLWGVYRYSRCWFSAATAWLAMGLVATSSAMAIALHVFGQLPNVLALALLFHAIPWLRQWLQKGRKIALCMGLTLALAAALTNLYASVFGLALFALPLVLEMAGTSHFPWRRWGLMLLLGGVMGLMALAPYFYFQLYEAAPATPVYHSSRSNVLAFRPFNWFMFYGQYGPLLIALPIWLWAALKHATYRLFVPSVLILFTLSLGGATPLARWLLGPLFHQVTLDRFGQWGAFLFILVLADFILNHRMTLKGKAIWSGFIGVHLIVGVYSACTTWWKPLPDIKNMTPVITFLSQPETQQYRYLTLGLQRANFAKLSTLVAAQSVDGNFPFGRNHPLWNPSGLSSLDDARRYGPMGWKMLEQVMTQAPDLHLKYILVAESGYEVLLTRTGWQYQQQLGSIGLWERTNIAPIPDQSRPPLPLFLRLLWGLLPLLLLLAFVLLNIPTQPMFNTSKWKHRKTI